MPRKHPNDDPRGAAPKKSGLTSRYKQAHGSVAGELADWTRCDGQALVALTVVVGNAGGALLLGYSRDRGAYRVIVMDDDDKITEWIPCTTDISEAIWNMAALLDDGEHQGGF